MDKRNEQMVMQQFAGLMQDWPKGKLHASESPDFILRISTRKAIGIELTELKGQDFLNHTGRLINPKKVLTHLENTIRAKEEKIYLYKKKRLVELWLLIHLESLNEGIQFHLENKLNNLKFSTGFDRIFLLELGREKLYELTNWL